VSLGFACFFANRSSLHTKSPRRGLKNQCFEVSRRGRRGAHSRHLDLPANEHFWYRDVTPVTAPSRRTADGAARHPPKTPSGAPRGPARGAPTRAPRLPPSTPP